MGAAGQPHLDEDARSAENCRGAIRRTPCRTRTIPNQPPAVPRWNDSAGAAIPQGKPRPLRYKPVRGLSERKSANELAIKKST
ncbi:hypothetical protein WJ0W_004540 [Paenibacillus melissococcoides]|uniref:Uncharacterized protein n=1 Tax=Paenibacillus melissococcoides TaxID=2912268 RepID=A0ABM9G609_9BACL|nr:hypothetical protein WJ0W_004540 [Paenibacillus melissococcoides]CAH8717318.1 hypothetical protein HTL2_004907 [Paenibacillus melissococcoides]